MPRVLSQLNVTFETAPCRQNMLEEDVQEQLEAKRANDIPLRAGHVLTIKIGDTCVRRNDALAE